MKIFIIFNIYMYYYFTYFAPSLIKALDDHLLFLFIAIDNGVLPSLSFIFKSAPCSK